MTDEHATTPLPSKSVLDDVVDLRRYFHKHPEVSFDEHETSRYLKDRLHELGLDRDGGRRAARHRQARQDGDAAR